MQRLDNIPHARSAFLILGSSLLAFSAFVLMRDVNHDSALPQVDSAAITAQTKYESSQSPASASLSNTSRTDPANRDPWVDRPGERPVSEDDYYRVLITLFAADRAAFLELAEQSLRASVPLAAQRAALRAWHDVGMDEPFALYLKALSSTEEATPLRVFAQQFVEHQAPSSEAARSTLIALLQTQPEDASIRAGAFFSVLRWGKDNEIHNCLSLVFSEQEPDVVERAARALADSDALGARGNLSDLKRSHPVTAVRTRLRERYGK